MSGYRTEAGRITNSMTSTPTAAAVKALAFGPLTHGPRTCLSLHSSKRNTLADGSSTPTRVCTPSVSRSSGEPGIITIVAAAATSPA